MDVDLRGDRSLTLNHSQFERRPMAADTEDVLKHVYRLWKFPVKLESSWADQATTEFKVPA